MKMHNPPHPGAIVADNIEALNMSLSDVAKALDVSASNLSRLTQEKIAISPEMAVRLSKVIGSSPEWWLRMQDAYSLYHAEESIDLSRLTPLFSASADNAPA
ncbi:XRE family transcriptional regulator [bacteria symbiont BFo1 of Frankliniella occidentalis]|uniref:HigA family addiction module antitoxin n=1 Tax=Erwinia TaxID=551 RepID=UPI0006646A54|nr:MULTISPECIES: HigA family addiction module antitoxin [Erwinia]KMV67581.1 XRE family transcriptional regulator [bacteria symbiont BFo1 of Frankliniella occidentalis]KYP82393.1 XRE family transcriptional regulator [bacteria symbiont BFo1 of Frankliniella occidentalis]KYP87057.1 XRE family transcriptional regulator [bacteria symbiont BFo1 of Frankliniella occidentalis]MDI3440205.1 HigA family addiction module antitoxin [Erwinia sp. V90_4]CAH0297025.1 putative HTH-type transcriptional regulator